MSNSPLAVGLRCACALLLSWCAVGTADAQEFFTYDAAAATSTTVHAPALEDAGAANTQALLKQNRGAGQPMAVRIPAALTGDGRAVLQALPLSSVFCDFVGTDRAALTAATARQLLGTTASRGAFVGNFNVYQNAHLDTTRPANIPPEAPRFVNKPTAAEWAQSVGKIGTRSAKRISMPALLPGSPDFRNPASGNSAAPNIRSALFMLPIQRLTFASLGIRGLSTPNTDNPGLYNISGRTRPVLLVPVISRFNNFGNAALLGAPTGNGFVQNAANPANGQLPSRGDFQAQVLHYRMRGATSVVLFHGTAVVGYSPAQHESDIVTGWNASPAANGIFRRNAFNFANLSNLVQDNPSNPPRSTEISGTVWSGVFDRAGVDRRLVILVSNLGNVQRLIKLPPIGGKALAANPDFALDPNAVAINPGQHRVLHFHFEANTWLCDGDDFIGLDNNRNGVGTGASDPPANPVAM